MRTYLSALLLLASTLVAGQSAWAGDYSAGGFKDSEAFDRFYASLQKSVAKNDKAATASLFAYPMSILFPPDKKPVKVATKDDFVKCYDRIFVDEIKDALQKTQTADLRTFADGVMVGNGELWLKPGSKGGVCIETVNIGP